MEYQEQSLGGQIFNRIRDDILSGNYTPGEELKEATLGKQLGVSRTPVREALRQLDLEGLVEIAPNRGAKVIGISRKDVEDIYHMQGKTGRPGGEKSGRTNQRRRTGRIGRGNPFI